MSQAQQYTISGFIKNTNHYKEPKPHPVWWRRWLGQTVSEPVGWQRVSRTVDIPKDMIDQKWLQDLLMDMSDYDWGVTLESENPATPSICTTENILHNNNTFTNDEWR